MGVGSVLVLSSFVVVSSSFVPSLSLPPPLFRNKKLTLRTKTCAPPAELTRPAPRVRVGIPNRGCVTHTHVALQHCPLRKGRVNIDVKAEARRVPNGASLYGPRRGQVDASAHAKRGTEGRNGALPRPCVPVGTKFRA